MQYLREKAKLYGDELEKYPFFSTPRQMGVRGEYVIYAAAGLLLTSLIFGLAGQIIVLLGGFLYPAYKSFKAIESKGSSDDTQWLMYWVVFTFTMIIDELFGFILSFIPFFYLLKLVFLMWLYLPSTCGATTIYNKFLAPFLRQHERKIDGVIDDVSSRYEASVGEGLNEVKARLGQPRS